jgi:hypothetical protein
LYRPPCAPAKEAGLKADETVAKLTVLAQTIEAASKGSELPKTIAAEQLAAAKGRYEAARKTAMGEIDRLRGIDAAEAEELAKAIGNVDGSAAAATNPGVFAKFVVRIDKIRSDAAIRATKLGKEAGEEQQILTEELDEVGALLDELDKIVAGLKNEKQQKGYQTLAQTLRTGLEQQRAMADLTQRSLLQAAVPEIIKLRFDVHQGIDAARNGKAVPGDSTLTMEEIRQRISDLKKKLGETEIKTFLAAAVFQTTTALDALDKALGDEPLYDSAVKAVELTRKTDQILADAAKARKVYDAFKADLEKIGAKLKQDIFTQAPKYTAYLKGELDAIRAEARGEGGFPTAKQDALRILAEIDGYLADQDRDARGVPKALAQREGDAVKDAEATKDLAAGWTGKYKVLAANIDRLEGVPSREKKALASSLEDANKNFEKTGDYEAATARWKAIEQRMRLLQENPGGLKLSARNSLPKVRDNWHAATMKFQEALSQLGAAINDRVTAGDIKADEAKPVTATLAQLRTMLNASGFDQPIDTMASQSESDEARSAAREVALRDVRRFRAYLTGDYRMLELARNPFHDRLRAVLAGLASTLADLENNMMASL